METVFEALQHSLSAAIQRAFAGSLDNDAYNADISQCAQEEFGHYQCNSALRLSKRLKQNPRAVAQKIVDALDDATAKNLSKVEIAGPGFINITLSNGYLSKQLQIMLSDRYLGAPRPKHKKKIIVEFSSPNIAKELHVGHIRSTIIGDCLARLFEFMGQDVLRLNHIGDWGTQFGMLIAYMKEHAPAVLKGTEPTDLQGLLGWYKLSKQRFDQDPPFKKRAQLEVVKLQSGDPEALHAWKLICDISRKGFQEIYDLLGVHILERGESFYNPYLKDVVEQLEQKGIVTISDGAKCIFLDGFRSTSG